jgi:hypothetical protein
MAWLGWLGWMVAAAGLAPGAGGAPAPLRIGTVTIHATSLFSEQEAAQGGIYRLVNRLHRPTRPELIRSFLLFHEGDPYNPLRVTETERNLRNLDFLAIAEITAAPPHDGVVDLAVNTQDAWRTNPAADFAHVKGVTTYDFDLTQKNFFGTGSDVTYTLTRDTERYLRSFEFSTPALFAPYWTTDLLVSRNSDGGERKLAFSRPFFSFANRWLFDFSADRLVQTKHLYDLAETTAGFRQRHRDLDFDLTYAIDASERHSRRLLVGLDLLYDRFRQAQGEPAAPLPLERNFRFFFVGYQYVANDFIKLAYVNQDLRVEDFNLGSELMARLGASQRSLDPGDHTARLVVQGSRGWRLGGESFLLSHLSYETRREDRRLANEIAGANLLYVLRLPARWLQTLVVRADYRRGIHLDRDVQFIADGLDGLRAYPVHAYGGDKRLLVNVEQRLFLGRELLQVFAPGAVVFFDAGAAPPPGKPLSFASLKSDAGAGLRFAIARAQGLVVRLDWAYQLNRDPFGHRGFVLSAGSSQAF